MAGGGGSSSKRQPRRGPWEGCHSLNPFVSGHPTPAEVRACVYPTHDSSVGPCCMSCLSPGRPTCPDPLCLYLGLSGPPVSTACLSLSDPGPESPLWKRDTRPREGRMPCVCVCVCVCTLSHAQLVVTSWTMSHQVPLSMEFPVKKTGVGFHFLPYGIFLAQGLNSRLLHLLHWHAGALPAEPLDRPLGGSLKWQHPR